MLERIIYDVIASGISNLKATPGAITKFFLHQAILSAEEAALVEDLFLNKLTPTVIHGYARSDTKFPVIAITLGSESENQAFLGDEGGTVGDQAGDPDMLMGEGDEDFGKDEFAAIFGYTFNLMVYAQNPDVVLWYYQLLKQMLIDGFPTFKQNGLFDLRFSGADMAPDPAWVPAGLFVRRATLSCSREYTQTMSPGKLDSGRAYRVQSIHIADGSGKDNGGVLEHVTIPEEE